MERRGFLGGLAALVAAPFVPTPPRTSFTVAGRYEAQLQALELTAEGARRAIQAAMRPSLALDELGQYTEQLLADIREDKTLALRRLRRSG